jgi:hypothetical protein
MEFDPSPLIDRCGDRLVEEEACDSVDPCCTSTCELAADDTDCGAGTCQGGACQVSGGRVTDGILSRYDFDEGAGTTVGDAGPAAADLTIDDVSQVSWGTGTLTMNGNTRISTVGSATAVTDALAASGAVTLEAWLVPEVLDEHRTILKLSPGADDELEASQKGPLFCFRIRSTKSTDGGSPGLESGAHDVATELTHLVMTRDVAGERRLYVNGKLRTVNHVAGTLKMSANGKVTLASDLNTSQSWHGTYHFAAIYDRALSAVDVARNFTAGVP